MMATGKERGTRMAMTQSRLAPGRNAGAFGLLMLALLLAACSGSISTPEPPRVTTPADVRVDMSQLVVPVSARLADLEARINAGVPVKLASIDRMEKACVPAQRVTVCLKHVRPCKGDACKAVPCKVGIKNSKVTPDVSCRIVGTVTRGRIRLRGDGDVIRISMPVSAELSAKDVGNVLSETATAAAEVRARARLGIGPDWKPTARVDIDYDWTKKPGIELLGKRFTFAGKADPKLAEMIAKLEADIPKHLLALNPRERIEAGWRKGFTSVQLNRRNPEVWMRITPRQLAYGGYRVEDGNLILALKLAAGVETFLGDRPADPEPTPLPDAGAIETGPGFRFSAPVIADYAQLEPVLFKALGKLAEKDIVVPVLGEIDTAFGKPIMFTTEGGKIAIGLDIAATKPDTDQRIKGRIWLTGTPYNEPNSPVIRVRNLAVSGETNRPAGQLLIAIAQAPAVQAEITRAISQDFGKDLEKLMGKIDKALAGKRLGDFVLNATITSLSHGVVQPIGQGVYLPIEVTGIGTLDFAPLSAAEKAKWEAERTARREQNARKDAEAIAREKAREEEARAAVS